MNWTPAKEVTAELHVPVRIRKRVIFRAKELDSGLGWENAIRVEKVQSAH